MENQNYSLSELLDSETMQLNHLSNIVKKSIEDEKILTTKLLEVERDTDSRFGDRCADLMASFGGSWYFIIFFSSFIFIWIALNIYFLKSKNIDPYPFILLNLILSCLAAFQAPVIMMSQNRKDSKDRMRLKSDYMVNLKAELELRSLHEKMDILITEQNTTILKYQKEQLALLLELTKNKA